MLDPKAGLPKVKQRLDFNELLRDIRLNKIDRVEYIDNAQYSDNWYKDPKSWNLIDGSCLVIYRDGHVAYVRPASNLCIRSALKFAQLHAGICRCHHMWSPCLGMHSGWSRIPGLSKFSSYLVDQLPSGLISTVLPCANGQSASLSCA